MLKKSIFETDYGTIEFDSSENAIINDEMVTFRFWHEDTDGYTVCYMQVISANSKEQYATTQIGSIENFARIREKIKDGTRPIKRK